MTLKQVRQAVKEGKTVHWGNHLYTVIKDPSIGFGLGILCSSNGNYVGLHIPSYFPNGEKKSNKDFFTK